LTSPESTQEGDVSEPLQGVTVLEYGNGIAAAYAGALLADLGASVEKVRVRRETAADDRAELRIRAEQIYLDPDKSIIEDELGSPSFARRFAAADIVLRGYEPSDGRAPDIRDEYERWKGASDSLTFVAITPFGVTGPASGWHGGDLQAQSLSGWTYVTGNPGEPPLSMNYGIGALVHGVNAAGAAVAGLLQRGQGRGGAFADVSEADVIAACMRMYSSTYRFLGIPMKRNGLRAPGSSGRYPHTALPCKDGYVSTICRSEQDWSRFLEMMGNPAWGNEPRYRDFFAMATDYPDEVDALIIPWLMEHTKDQIADLATAYKVPIAPLRTADEVVRDPQFAYRKFLRVRRADGKDVLVPGRVMHWTSISPARSPSAG
jgi:crotonobetainyl-CoA:carnitine CoA-transferase CaiB-like acyl-CoA transferase